ncbi:MAG: hypothetical protein WAW90_02175 [Minisyncoccia bacterium]
MIFLSNLFLLPMKRLTRKLGAEYISLDQESDFSHAMRLALDEFKKSCKAKYPIKQLILEHIRNLAKQKLQGDEYIARIYDIEYADIGKVEQCLPEQESGGVTSGLLERNGKCHYSIS